MKRRRRRRGGEEEERRRRRRRRRRMIPVQCRHLLTERHKLGCYCHTMLLYSTCLITGAAAVLALALSQLLPAAHSSPQSICRT